MKRRLLVFGFLFCSLVPIWSVDIVTKLRGDLRFSATNGAIQFDLISGSIKLDSRVNETFYAIVNAGFRYYNIPGDKDLQSHVISSSDLTGNDSMYPVDFLLNEAYFSMDDFLFKGLEISIGKQRFAWGTADVFNPTDIVNPGDYFDLLSLGLKSASLAWSTRYHFFIRECESDLQFIFQPWSPVAKFNISLLSVLESEIYNRIFDRAGDYSTSYNDETINWLNPEVDLPEFNLFNAAYAVRYSMNIGPVDFSLSAIWRINDLPYVQFIKVDHITEINTGTDTTNITLISKNYDLAYYHETVLGMDFSWNTGIFVLWGEAGLTFPDKKNTVIISDGTFIYLPAVTTNVYVMNQTENFITNVPYLKYTLGGDCMLEKGWYLNVQFAHGFFTERGLVGTQKLQDYMTLRVEKALLNDHLKIGLTGILNQNTWSEAFQSPDFGAYFSSHYGTMLKLAVDYKPVSGLVLSLGGMIFRGSQDCTLGKYNQDDLIYTSFEYTF